MLHHHQGAYTVGAWHKCIGIRFANSAVEDVGREINANVLRVCVCEQHERDPERERERVRV